ncbi:MAG: YkgJ family cysteine cluster protein [Caldimicrobium sp.]|nr:YkgJ family cysteine cluster protein [Caldimicrobium sp.]MCX7873634.1 YkgJ family cysteine cluster protein [Caldimicrobium sp.]MDW8094325.1 YkgJ family cysteine cluster protein [Caldimicrobium sp.]
MLKALYEHLEESFKNFVFACERGCNFCCTNRLFVTSLEAKFIFDVLEERDFLLWKDYSFPIPRITHNQTLWLYFQGEEPPFEEFSELTSCPFLTQSGLCAIYERRPLMCRIMVSKRQCTPDNPAEPPKEAYLMGLLALQIVENIDVGGLYGNLFLLLNLWKDFYGGVIEEIPPYFLPTHTFEELPLLPSERELRTWVGTLYRKKLNLGLTFRELLDQIRRDFKKTQSLSFLEDIFTS